MVKNQEMALQIKEMLLTLQEALEEAKRYLYQDQKVFCEIISVMEEMLLAIDDVSEKETEEVYKELSTRCRNCLFSLRGLSLYAGQGRLEDTEQKLEIELLPLLRIAFNRFYYEALVVGDQEREARFWKDEALELGKNAYTEEGMRTGYYKYDVTIYVVAYNKLEYTRLCVEHILKSMPDTLRCELILVNHGSEDGTREYFESIQPNKQVDIKINSMDGFFIPFLIAEGKYILGISNDVLLSKNAIELMYECMEEDIDIGYIVPATPNISNLQGIVPAGISYQSIEEFEQVTEHYNKRDKRLEECRTRLLNPLWMLRMEYYSNSSKSLAFIQAMLRQKQAMFGDDAQSLFFRRSGYKNILMKDVYCHHFGSVTLGKTYDYLGGRREFFKQYGVDAWEKGVCYTQKLFQSLICNKADAETILGINAGIGSDALKIREELKAHTENTNVKLINYTMEKRFLPDLKGISDEAAYVSDWKELRSRVLDEYDYILVCGGLEGIRSYQSELEYLYKHVKKNGVLIFKTADQTQAKWFKQRYKIKEQMVEAEDYICCEERMRRQYYIYAKK